MLTGIIYIRNIFKESGMLVVDKGLNGGRCKRYMFSNGLGASVVSGPNTYGGEEGLWELAVIRWDGDEFFLAYDTPITDDVVGYLTWEEVEVLLTQIGGLS